MPRHEWKDRPLVWLKTEHSYPNRAALEPSWKGLEEVLVGSGYLAAETLAMAQRLKAARRGLGHISCWRTGY